MQELAAVADEGSSTDTYGGVVNSIDFWLENLGSRNKNSCTRLSNERRN